jgi:regulator of sirC expression with transglutaminase-like and TPR domain
MAAAKIMSTSYNRHRFYIVLALSLWACGALAAIDAGKPSKISPELKPVRNLFALPEDKIDLAQARLIIEKYLDPSLDVDASLNEIDRIVAEIRKVPRYSDSTEGKLNGIVQYLYIAGEWNGNKPYRYDFDDPLGTAKPQNSRLSNYLKTRTGNCVSMPMLVLIVGQKLGLDMSLSTAPLHLFVRLRDAGGFYNFEATAGGLKAGSSYVKEFMITPQAIKNGVYLQSLSKKQALTVMLNELAQHYSQSTQNSDFDIAFELTALMLEHYPNNVTAMIIRGNTWRNIMYRDLGAAKKQGIKQMTPPMKKHFDELLARNLQWYDKAEALGWREPPKDYDVRYLQMVKEARKSYE